MSSAQDPPRPAKRHKTILVCCNCRARKVRCSGQRPHCATCIARRETTTCAYDDVAFGTINHDPSFDAAPSHNDNQCATRRDSQLPDVSQEAGPPTSTQSVDWNGNTIAPAQVQWPSLSPMTASANETSPAQHSHHTNRSVSESLLPQSDIGLSNSGGFLKAVVNATTAESSSRRRPAAAKYVADLGVVVPSAGESRRANVHSEDLLLPPRREMTRLLDVYRRTNYPIFPILDMSLILSEVDALWKGDTQILHQRTLHCLLNYIFALAAQSHPPEGLADDESCADPYLQRGRNLMATNVLEGFSFSQLQTTLICSQFLLSTDRLQQA